MVTSSVLLGRGIRVSMDRNPNRPVAQLSDCRLNDARSRFSRRSIRARAEKNSPVPERDGCRLARSRMSSAHWRVRRAAWPSPFLRGADDPLTRSHGRDSSKRPSVNGDPRALGVGKLIAKFLKENFGNPMYGSARTLMIVVLGLDPDKAPTRSAIRVAFEKDRCAQGR